MFNTYLELLDFARPNSYSMSVRSQIQVTVEEYLINYFFPRMQPSFVAIYKPIFTQPPLQSRMLTIGNKIELKFAKISIRTLPLAIFSAFSMLLPPFWTLVQISPRLCIIQSCRRSWDLAANSLRRCDRFSMSFNRSSIIFFQCQSRFRCSLLRVSLAMCAVYILLDLDLIMLSLNMLQK